VRLQPANPQTWLQLAGFDVNHEPRAALHDLGPALFLDPQSIQAQTYYVIALRNLHPNRRIAGAVPPRPVNNPGAIGPSG